MSEDDEDDDAVRRYELEYMKKRRRQSEQSKNSEREQENTSGGKPSAAGPSNALSTSPAPAAGTGDCNAHHSSPKRVDDEAAKKLERQRQKNRERKHRRKEKKAMAAEAKKERAGRAKEEAEAVRKRKREEEAERRSRREGGGLDWKTCRLGVRFADVVEGRGPKVQDRKRVHVKYVLRAKPRTGKILDSSSDFSFRLGKGEVIRGWDIGLIGMRQGGVRHLVVPPGAGYGSKNIGAGSGADLFFEVTLLSC